ncbi:integrase, catalytic region, zinc finger, CCHC-type containing protein [Tanacetum coccineum]
MLQKETLLDVGGTSGRHYGVFQSFPVERIKQGNEWRVLSLFATSRSKKHHIVPFEELNGVPVALVARFEVISKSTDRIFVSDRGDDPIACLNKTTAFLSSVVASRFPLANNQLRTSSNPRNQATIQDGKVTIQQVQGRQGQSFAGTGTKGNATSSGGNNVASQARVVKCYNCQGEGNMARQCTKPKG